MKAWEFCLSTGTGWRLVVRILPLGLRWASLSGESFCAFLTCGSFPCCPDFSPRFCCKSYTLPPQPQQNASSLCSISIDWRQWFLALCLKSPWSHSCSGTFRRPEPDPYLLASCVRVPMDCETCERSANHDTLPRGSKYPIFHDSGPKYH